MYHYLNIAAWLLPLLLQHPTTSFAAEASVQARPPPAGNWMQIPKGPHDINAAIATLAPLLSNRSSLILPHHEAWNETQLRGSSPRISPNYKVVVEVATEEDISNTLMVANLYNIPALATAGTHGWTKTLGAFNRGGFQIRLRKLNGTEIAKDGKTATIGGGVLQYEVTRALFEKNKQAVTGLCECVSVAGPLLGGGHSILQGRYGYAADNLVSARVVLYNGTAVTASATSNPDLYWAIRGAGHNFGVVASLQVKIHEIQENWTSHSLFYTHDKLEALLELVNKVDSAPDRSPNLVLIGVATRIPPMDPKNPVILYALHYEGTPEEAAPIFNQFKALGPLRASVTPNITYSDLHKSSGNSLDGSACRRNLNVMGNGASLTGYNATAGRAAFNVFKDLTADPRFNSSALLFENYGMGGVRAVNSSSAAIPLEERMYPAVANPTIWWRGNNAQTAADAYSYGERIRQAFYAGAIGGEKHAYVNYAIGTETFGEVYGFEEWRGERLKGLKRRWDPENKFGFYNPVPLN